MSQIFHPSANGIARIMLGGLIVLVAASGFLLYYVAKAPYVTRAFEARQQPIQFSHERHVAGNGIDCRYCHTAVEKSATAGIPPTKTCMNCHAQIRAQSAKLLPVRESYASGMPIPWVKVHDLPDFVYYDHSAHLNAVDSNGQPKVQCQDCHGRVQDMDIVSVQTPFNMGWCLSCHRKPEMGASTDCSVCHR